jgi:hypothetical protein
LGFRLVIGKITNLKGFAPHIHVLYREVPFILNISVAACSYNSRTPPLSALLAKAA